MKNHTTTKVDNVFDEIWALLAIEQLYPGSVDNIYKWESPDWKKGNDSLGIEVTKAQSKHIGYTYNVMTKYFGTPKNQIPIKLLHNFCGETIFANGKLFGVSDSNGLVDGNRHIQLLLKHLEIKLRKLNDPHFTVCAQNYLFEFCIGWCAEHDKLEFAEGIKRVTASYLHTFDKIIVHALDSILCFSPGHGISVHSVPFKKLNYLSGLYRNSSTWEKGTLFSDIQKQILNQK